MFEIAKILKDRERVGEFVQLLNQFKEKDIVKGREIVNKLEFLENIEKHRMLNELYKQEVLKVIKPSYELEEYYFEINDDVLDQAEEKLILLVDNFPIDFLERKDVKQGEIKVVATLPNIFFENQEILKIPSVSSSMAKLITEAEKEIWIVNPFFDDFASSFLLPHIENALNRGIEVKIITRPFETSDKMDMPIFEKKKEHKNLRLRELSKEDGENWYSLHSKILLKDDIQCYLGSANITERSFKSNFEIGVLIRGEPIKKISSIIEELWEISSKT